MKTKITVMLTAIFIGMVVFAVYKIKSQSEDLSLLRQNMNYYTKLSSSYKTKDSLNVLSIQKLNLTLKEYGQNIGSLRVDASRLKSIIASQSLTIYQLSTPLKDTVVLRDSVFLDTIRCARYVDKWINLHACISQGVLSTNLSLKDSITYIEHVVPHRFLWVFKWGVKERKQEIFSSNPHTSITKATYISIIR